MVSNLLFLEVFYNKEMEVRKYVLELYLLGGNLSFFVNYVRFMVI